MQKLDYRPDLDGLRGFGVLIVILFHVGFSEPSGGFVAVDMFFVISGFLITRLIRHEYLQTGSFSYSNFYVRRARRLMPALFFTLAVCLGVGAFVFTPADLERFGGAVVHAVASLSNFYFWSEAGYFDKESSLKPLLHTWSLGVEEQFYLIWPASLLLLLSKARRFTVPVILAVGAASLALNLMFADGEVGFVRRLWPPAQSWIADGHSTIYFLAPFRVFEFAIGSAAVWWNERSQPGRLAAEGIALLGLAMLVVPMFVYTEKTVFPSVAGLPPCLGTAFLIHTRDARCNRLLSNRVWVGLGLASYSIYLIHQPIMAFYRYLFGDLSIGVMWALSAASVLAGLAMHRFVERPFRHGHAPEKRWSPAGFGMGCAMCALALTLVSANAWGNRGWTWRYGESRAARAFGGIDEMRRDRMTELNRRLGGYFAAGRTAILVVGDSLADDLALALGANLGGGFDVQRDRYRPKCAPMFADPANVIDAECAGIINALDLSLKIPVADRIFISFQVDREYHPEEFVPLVGYLKRRARPGVQIVLFGRGPEFEGFQRVAVTMLSEGATTASVEERAREYAEDVRELDRQLSLACAELGIGFFSKTDSICTADRCRYFTDFDDLVFWDKNHMSVAGSQWWGSQIVQSLGFAPVPKEELARRGERARAELPPNPLEAPDLQVTHAEAAKILEAYGATLGSASADGSALIDASRLPYPKDRIRAAILLLIGGLGSDERAGLKNAMLTLAYFQPGVGEGLTLDAVREDETPWREVVEAEMTNTVRLLTDHGF